MTCVITLQLHSSNPSMDVSHWDCRTNAIIAGGAQNSRNVKCEHSPRRRPRRRPRPRIRRKTSRTRTTMVIKSLDDNVSLDDVIDRLYLLRKIELGIAQANAGDVVEHDEFMAELEREDAG